MRNKKIITTAEYMVIYNFHLADFDEFCEFIKIPRKKMREHYKNGLNKMIKYKKNEKIKNKI